MKKLLRPLFLTGIVNSVAQPVLTNSAFAPQLGDQYICGHSGLYYAGSAGANLSWNFSAASIATMDTFSLVSSSSVPCGSQFTQATLASKKSGTSTMIDVNSLAYSYYGNCLTPGMAGYVYSDPEELFHYPMNYSNSYTDFSQAVDMGGPVYRKGYDTISYVGYGTISTPYGTYPNTICIHRRFVYSDSSQFGQNPCAMNYYYWFAAGYRYPVAQSWATDANCSAIGQGTLFLQSITIGIAENSVSTSSEIFPNPSQGTFTIRSLNEGVYSVVNELGQVVQSVKLNNLNNYNVTVEALESGIYFIVGYNGNGIVKQKVIITR